MPDHVVDTPHLIEGVETAFGVIQTCTIGLFDGPVGTGKSTTKEWVCQQMDVPTADITMPPRPAPLTALRTVVKGLTGERIEGSKDRLEDIAVDLLTGWGGLLAVDEVQTIGTPGILELRYLHHMTRETFGLLLVGHGAEAAVRNEAALDDRIVLRTRFHQLRGQALINVLNEIDDRLARTTPAVIARLDQKHCRGRLRDWAQVLLVLDTFYPDAKRISGHLANSIHTHLSRQPIADPLADGDAA